MSTTLSNLQNLIDIKHNIEEHIGEHITLITYAHKHIPIKQDAIISKIFNAIFVLTLTEDNKEFTRLSFTYKDILTNNISICYSI